MKDHPTPQPSGRTARQLLIDFGLGCADTNSVTKVDAEQIERQLFDAMLEIVAQTPFYELKDGWAVDKDRLEAKLRVFFNQSKDGDE